MAKRQTPGTIDILSLSKSEQELIKRAAEAHPAPVNITQEESAHASSLVQQGFLTASTDNVTATELGMQASSML